MSFYAVDEDASLPIWRVFSILNWSVDFLGFLHPLQFWSEKYFWLGSETPWTPEDKSITIFFYKMFLFDNCKLLWITATALVSVAFCPGAAEPNDCMMG